MYCTCKIHAGVEILAGNQQVNNPLHINHAIACKGTESSLSECLSQFHIVCLWDNYLEEYLYYYFDDDYYYYYYYDDYYYYDYFYYDCYRSDGPYFRYRILRLYVRCQGKCDCDYRVIIIILRTVYFFRDRTYVT